MTVRIIQNPRLREQMREDLSDLARDMANKLTKEMKRLTPKRTGKTAESIEVLSVKREAGKIVGYISANKIYGYLEAGTKAHYVRPVRAKALRWLDTGGIRPGLVPRGYLAGTGDFKVLFSKGHMVKGIRPLHIFERAFKIFSVAYRRSGRIGRIL